MNESKLRKLENNISIIQKIVTAAAIVIGGAWTYNTFVVHREGVSKANISHHIEKRKLSDDYILIQVYNKIENVGNAAISLRRGHVRIEDISFPNSYIEKKIATCIEPCLRKVHYFNWNVIQDVSFEWEKGQRIIEPSSYDALVCEFIIRPKYKVVKVYSFFTDEKKTFDLKDDKGKIVNKEFVGWSASTLYNIQSQ